MSAQTLGTMRRAYGRQRRSGVGDGAGIVVLDFGRPEVGSEWVVTRMFVKNITPAGTLTVELIVGSDPGNPAAFDPQDQDDEVTTNPAIWANDEIDVKSTEPIWVRCTVAAGDRVVGNIRYRVLVKRAMQSA